MVAYTQEIPGILAVEIFDPGECRTIIDNAKSVAGWTEAKVSAPVAGGFTSATRTEARRASVVAPAHNSEIRRMFDERMDRLVKPVVEEVWAVEFSQHSETHFVRYVSGNYYSPHSDTGQNRGDRYFTVLCYLNDDFEGGGTSFPTLDYSITPHPGKAVIFPATFLHCAEPITSGEKYVLVSWLTGPPPFRWI